ncbi:hypothetical protein BS50DRAFT_498919 [Corynespora cassiicola Philippines]|uniref:DUF3176 domain-containing protein n=1 Tax=Corynespora cassiicola Philippines TaxID=1448308 RepID=A0A2T2NG34_CORCC|nr:hypothetical protein BS50DRAFT_498919 [Corynespora cassiicola Philippines]
MQQVDRPSTNATTFVNVEKQEKQPLPQASTTFFQRTITDWWWWELLSWIVSFSAVAAIIGVLLYYDGKKQPDHVLPGITLNAYVAIFAAIAKAAMILPISEAIGQLKWLWFNRGSRIWDFQTFDSASRGPWGSLILLGTTKCKHLVSLGACITVLALAFEPFFQQIVTFPTRKSARFDATMPIANVYRTVDEINYHVDSDNRMRNIPRSLYLDVGDAINSREKSVRPPSFVCPSGNCDWSLYTSLGICHRCEDISELMDYVCGEEQTLNFLYYSTLATNPCGYRFQHAFAVGTYSPSKQNLQKRIQHVLGSTGIGTRTRDRERNRSTVWNSTVYGDVSNPIADFYMSFVHGGEYDAQRNSPASLYECMFHWCAKTFNATYENGQLHETLVSTESKQVMLPGYNESMKGPFAIASNGKTFTIPQNVTAMVEGVIQAYVPTRLDNDDVDSTGKFPGIWDFIRTPPYDINVPLAKIAEAATNNMRLRTNDTEMVNGTAWTNENFVQIRWPWVTLPATLLLSTLVFVCATILETRRQNAEVYKSSALATLLHGITEDVRERYHPAASLSEVEAMSQKLDVKLSSHNGNSRLVAV